MTNARGEIRYPIKVGYHRFCVEYEVLVCACVSVNADNLLYITLSFYYGAANISWKTLVVDTVTINSVSTMKPWIAHVFQSMQII